MARKLQTREGNVRSVEHIGGSRYGNPTYLVTFTDGRNYRTSLNAGVAYAATNYRPHSLSLPVSPVVLTLTPALRIVDMARPAGWLDPRTVPADFPVRPLPEGHPDATAGCGSCLTWWDDRIGTQWTPAPSARCPFEYFHPRVEA